MSERYTDLVMDHFMNPRNVGEISDADGIGQVGNPVCGDVMRIYLKLDGDRIKDVKFKTFGCGAAIATSSMITELVMGKTIDEALRISNHAVADALGGLPARKMHCSNLAADALLSAVNDYRERHGLPPAGEVSDHDHPEHEEAADDVADHEGVRIGDVAPDASDACPSAPCTLRVTDRCRKIPATAERSAR